MRYEQHALDELYDIRDHYLDVEAQYDEQHARAIFARSQRRRVDAEIRRREDGEMELPVGAMGRS